MESFPMDLLDKPNYVNVKKKNKRIHFDKTTVRRTHADLTPRHSTEGKTYTDFIEFWFLMFVAILDSVIGLFILAYSIWSYVRKAYLYSSLFTMGIDMSYFTMIGSLVGICCPWITVKINKLRLEYIFALISMELVEVVVLITGLSIGNVYLPNYTNASMSVRVTFPSQVLNESFYTLFENYDNNSRDALDRIQSNLWCCGSTKKEDYMKNEIIMPGSCCPQGDCVKNPPFFEGCRILVQRDIAWHTVTLKSLSTLMMAFYIASLLMAVGVYISEASKLKNQSSGKNQVSLLS